MRFSLAGVAVTVVVDAIADLVFGVAPLRTNLVDLTITVVIDAIALLGAGLANRLRAAHPIAITATVVVAIVVDGTAHPSEDVGAVVGVIGIVDAARIGAAAVAIAAGRGITL
mgnify:CR=1 FL=1